MSLAPDVRGHARVKDVLERLLERDRVPQSLLFVGPDGVGKRLVARALAQALQCEAASAAERPCGRCRSCRHLADAPFTVEAAVERRQELEKRQAIDRGTAPEFEENVRPTPDVLVVYPSRKKGEDGAAASARRAVLKVDQLREAGTFLQEAPFEARRRVAILVDAHGMNAASQNALLKVFEEPRSTSWAILVTHQPEALLPTVRSRCPEIAFGPLAAEDVAAVLAGAEGDPERLARCAALSEGSPGRALDLLREGFLELEEALVAWLAQGAPAREALVLRGLLTGKERTAALALRSLMRDVAAARAGVPAEALRSPRHAEPLASVAAGPLGARAVEIAERAAVALQALDANANVPLTLDALLAAVPPR
ncbi:MAG: hypothetical protein KJ067_20765 [Vicinamibacteria bacterium]|nr:hypothetical protein [Vicinamibacteria bacterium]